MIRSLLKQSIEDRSTEDTMGKIVGGYELDMRITQKAFQMSAIFDHENMTSEAVFFSAIEIIGEWLKAKLRQSPTVLEKLENLTQDIQIEYEGIIVNTICDLEAKQWGLKYYQPDSSVPARIWTTQVSIYEKDRVIRCDVLNQCTSPRSCDIAVPLTTPGFIEPLNRFIGLVGVERISNAPMVVDDGKKIETLFNLVSNPRRRLPVLVISESRNNTYYVDAKALANSSFGSAIVVELSAGAAEMWTARIGRLWSVFDGGVRTYYPDVDFELGDMYRHPLMIRERIQSWFAQEGGRQDLESWLSNNVRSKAMELVTSYGTQYLFNEMQQQISQTRRAKIRHSQNYKDELLDAYEKDNVEQQRIIREKDAEIKSLEYANYELGVGIEERNKVNRNLRTRNDELLGRLKAKGQDENEIVLFPETLDGFEEWCDKYLAGRIVLSSKAKRGIKQSTYNDVQLIYRAVYMLGHEYLDMRLAIADQQAYEDKCTELGVESKGKPISEARLGETDGTYFFDYDGQKVFMDHHLCKGNSHDPVYTLRIYFAWDEDSGRVLIGSLPEHLDTRISN